MQQTLYSRAYVRLGEVLDGAREFVLVDLVLDHLLHLLLGQTLLNRVQQLGVLHNATTQQRSTSVRVWQRNFTATL